MITRSNQQDVSVREFMRGGKEYVKLQALSAELPEKARLFSKLSLIPGASIGYHVHTGESELFYVLEGNGSFNDDGQVYDIAEGDSTLTTSGHGHSIENTGDSMLVILAVIVRD